MEQTNQQTAAKAKPRERRMARQPSSPAAPADKTASEPCGPSKIAQVVALLKRDDGATLPELIEATGWLPHTMRAALTGLRKKGHVVAKTKRGDATCYKIEAAE